MGVIALVGAWRDRRTGRAPVAGGPRRTDDAPGVSVEDVRLVYRELLDRHPIPAELAHHRHHSPTVRDLLVAVASGEERRLRVTASRELAARAFVANLQLLNDTLATSPLADRYWVCGGLLLGWARDGRPLAHDCADADFGIHRADLEHFKAAANALTAAGFAPLYVHRNNHGDVTEYTFWRDGAKFEFFVMDPAGTNLQYYVFGAGDRGEGPVQAVCAIASQPLAPFGFLDRTWRKPVDHDAELTQMYGDWRVPDSDWNYMDDRAIVSRTAWLRSEERAWTGTFAEAENE
jgi:hypothetical protein